MNNKDLLSSIRTEIESTGQSSLNSVDLVAYITQLEELAAQDPEGLTNITIEKLKTHHDFTLAHFHAQADSNLEMFRSVIASGDSAMKASITISGGAAVSLLAFIGHLVATQPPQVPGFIGRFAPSMACFVGGVLAGAVAFGERYVTQWFYARGKTCVGNISNLFTIALTTGSFISFGVGAFSLYRIFASL